MEYKIGMCVKINTSETSMPWYTNEILTIIGVDVKSGILRIDELLSTSHHYNLKYYLTSIHPKYVFSYTDCIRHERKVKLEILCSK